MAGEQVPDYEQDLFTVDVPAGEIKLEGLTTLDFMHAEEEQSLRTEQLSSLKESDDQV